MMWPPSRRRGLRRRPLRSGDRSRGFTLVELLTVLVIVGLLVAFVLAGVRWAQEWSMINRARGEMNLIMTNLAEFKTQTGEYNLGFAFGGRGGQDSDTQAFSFREVARSDPWGQHYQITVRDTPTGDQWVSIRSAGPDRQFNTPDDLVLESN